MAKMTKEDLELKNKSSNTALCLAAAAGNVKMVEIMVKKNGGLVGIAGSQGMTPLYMAALFGHYKMVKCLYGYSKKLGHDCWTPQNRGWLLVKCVEADMFDIALKILEAYPELGISASALGVLARKTDVFTETESNIIKRAIDWVWTCIHPKEGPSKKENKANALKVLRIIWKQIAERKTDEIDAIIRGPHDPIKEDNKPPFEDQAVQLLKKNSADIAKGPKNVALPTQADARPKNVPSPSQTNIATPTNVPSPSQTNARPTDVPSTSEANARPTNVASPSHANARINLKYSSRTLFVATEMGNTRFIIELIRLYPDLIWKVNDDGLSIFHTAVKHRHEGIYNLLYEIGSMKDLITPLRDDNDNNMLHLVGMSAKKKRLEDVSGVAFQMQRELLWFKEVEEMIPPSYRERKNKEGLSPHELFTKEHKDLVKQGEDWMKDTASQCMVVAALIATIVFAAAFTVPGGYDQDDGIPIFSQKVTFIIFVVADAISLFSSSASILMFLSILTSRYAERDFLISLPKKLMLGLATLFLSITTMMVAFSVSFFVLYHRKLKWIPILITFLSVLPVVLYAMLQFTLLKDIFSSTYTSRYLFKPKKHVLYYENSKPNPRWFPFTIPFISTSTLELSKNL